MPCGVILDRSDHLLPSSIFRLRLTVYLVAKAGQRILSQFRRGLLARARQLTIGMELIQFLLHNRQYIRIPIGSKPLGVDCTRTDREGFNRVDESRVGRQVGWALDGRKEREDVINMIRLSARSMQEIRQGSGGGISLVERGVSTAIRPVEVRVLAERTREASPYPRLDHILRVMKPPRVEPYHVPGTSQVRHAIEYSWKSHEEVLVQLDIVLEDLPN
mmetsp:Transcript_30979/g.69971  ORF Transcript_30979/g.69971 Transcript_30979/m.69971 type:complete len:218 (-) Transcript_30979:240-893(-)